jgi:predicted nucleic acid-binding protein
VIAAVLVDSNVLLDIMNESPAWFSWSSTALSQAADSGRVIINPVIYGEISVHFDTIEELDDTLADTPFDREPLPYEAAFLAGKAHLAYRRRGGTRQPLFPDFLIGAHAAIAGYRLLTRDISRYRTYYPRLQVITPAN